jgi:hypothetical protein
MTTSTVTQQLKRFPACQIQGFIWVCSRQFSTDLKGSESYL